MNWVEIVWIAMSAASLTLAFIHLFVWVKQKSQYAHLLFFALAVSATAFSGFELALMHAPSPATYATTLRWAHVPLAMFVLSIVWFVRFHFGAGRLWLAWSASAFRLLALALNFLTGANINFREVTALDPMVLWGGVVVAGPVGIVNPLAIVAQIGNLLLAAFVVDASITLWRRGGADARRRAAVVGGSVVTCIVAVAGFAALITLGLVHAPTIVMPGVFLVVLGMGYELGWDMIAAAQLAARLRASELRFRAVVEAVPSAILLVDDKGLITLANAQAEAVFGYALFLSKGVAGIRKSKPVFLYNLLDLERTVWDGPELGAGKHTIVFDYKPSEPGLGKGGTGVLSVDGKEVARKAMAHSTPITFPEDETFDIGQDTRTGVAMLEYRYDVPFKFTGTIDKLTFKLEPEQVSAAEREEMKKTVARARD